MSILSTFFRCNLNLYRERTAKFSVIFVRDNSIDKVRHSCLVFLRSGKITAIDNYGGKKKPLEPEQLTGQRKHE